MTASNVIEPETTEWEEGTSAPAGNVAYVPVRVVPREQPLAGDRAVDLPAAPVWLQRADLAIVVASLCAAHVYAVLRTRSLHIDTVFGVTLSLSHVLTLLLCTCVWSGAYHVFGVYTPRRPGLRRELGRLALAGMFGALFTVLV
ncbi:MAG TPA: hypothetical protein VNU46_02745, partial [Gemmatimonadaceae bacterium]|nr:hypothetical protein [Gemmatimonadaceae bacterium]